MNQNVIARIRGDSEEKPTFMSSAEFRDIRIRVLQATQESLAEQLISPETGHAVKHGTVFKWEHSRRAIPLWAARKMRSLADAAREYDSR